MEANRETTSGACTNTMDIDIKLVDQIRMSSPKIRQTVQQKFLKQVVDQCK